MQRDGDGNVTSMTDPNGNTTSYTYNSDGELTGIDHPAGRGDETFEYDDLSRVTAFTDGKNQRTVYTYDPMDRVKTVTAPGGLVVTYDYDTAGNRISSTDATGTTTSTLDRHNRLTAESLSVGGSTSYAYDGVGNLTSFTDLGGTVTYDYNPVNLVQTLTQPATGGGAPGAGEVISFQYDEDNQRTSTTYPNDVTQTADYDASGRLTRIGGSRDAGTYDETVLTDFTYTYTTADGEDGTLRRSVTDHTGATTTYTYDDVERLERAVIRNDAGAATKVYDYGYDAVSNRTSTQVDDNTPTRAAYNAANQLCWTAPTTSTTGSCGSVPTGAVTYAYDANGNTTATSGPSSAGGGMAYSYNAFNQTTSITPAGGPAAPAEYMGTTQDQRTRYTDTQDGVTRTFTNTHSLLGLTTRTQTNPTETHAYTTDPTGQVLGRRTSTGVREYYLFDALGSIAATTTSTGTVDRRYTYDPYGGTTSNLTSGFDSNPYRYTGEYQDNNTSHYAIGARYLNPTLGRWTQPDPLANRVNPGQPGETNPYAYVGCNPTNY